MGFRHSILLILPLLLASPARAQDNGAEPIFNLPRTGTSPPADNRRQGPELDVFRAPATQPIAPAVPEPVPPVIAPSVIAPPIAAPTPAPPVAAAPRREARRSTATSTVPPKEEPRAAPRPKIDPAPPPPPERDAASSAAPPVIAPAPPPATRAAASAAMPWGWIAAAAALLAMLVAALILRRRSRAVDEAVAEEPPSPAPVVPPSPAPAPPPPPSAKAENARARLDCALEVDAARYSLMGATISYRIAVHNRGEQPADDILIRALLTNAGTAEQATLDAFLDQSLGSPAHIIVALAPGENRWLSGELRLSPDEIAPLLVGDRALLVPLALFDLHYRWSDGEGRLARSFLVGQAPAQAGDRLAPLRIDTGHRQFRNPAARAVGDLVSR